MIVADYSLCRTTPNHIKYIQLGQNLVEFQPFACPQLQWRFSQIHFLRLTQFMHATLQLRRLASALTHVNSTFRSSAVIGLLRPQPRPRELTYIYNTILNFIWVSFSTAYIFVTFRVTIRVRVQGLGSGLHFDGNWTTRRQTNSPKLKLSPKSI